MSIGELKKAARRHPFIECWDNIGKEEGELYSSKSLKQTLHKPYYPVTLTIPKPERTK